ncbi:bacteriophage abortive infection AbiH family protein [Candidatus Pantoea formicae]|uniref:bacteriophage abortive infection AbiH family protein n=1 Tax=Candidatus Pantoea formicae TaxID=2608355 RepID=UPI003ED8E7BB
MNTTTLYVIGNGFDLRHNIPSSLWHFKEYLQATDSDIYRDVEEYLPVDDDWCDLETALADLDADMLINNLGHFMSSYGDEDWSDAGHHDFQYEVDQVVRRLSKGLRSRFGQWIRQLQIPSLTGAPNRLTNLDPQALFLTFNYTSTLSRVYGIGSDRVLHIHGSAEAKDDELILGHAWEPESRASLNDRSDIADMDTRLMEANSIIDDYFCATFKPSQNLIASNQHFFEGLSEVKQVMILGHSLSVVDEAYFQALFLQKSVAAAQWSIACRSEEEWLEKSRKLDLMGIRPASVRQVSWDTL